jgi:hypothetical protein
MTNPEITQADRDLVASLLDADDELVEQINAGLAFSAECICAARHRMLGRAEGAAQERAEIVDWLRENAPQYSHEQLADAIERGEYKRSE